MTRSIPLLVAKAREDLRTAEDDLKLSHVNAAASRAYYAMFHVAQGLLASENLAFSKHSAVIAEYGRVFAKSARLDPVYHAQLQAAFERRGDADYDETVHTTPAEAQEVIGWAHEFIDAASDYLGPLAASDEA